MRPPVLSFDHIHPNPARTLDRPSRTAIFYADLTSPNFRELHSYLFALAEKPSPSTEYIFRHIPPKSAEATPPRSFLSGYGVALDLKKMDYLAVDDRNIGRRVDVDTSAEADVPLVDSLTTLIEGYPEREITSDDPALSEEDILGIAVFRDVFFVTLLKSPRARVPGDAAHSGLVGATGHPHAALAKLP